MSATEENLKPENGAAEAPPVSMFRKIISNITVEPLVICWLLPFLLTYAAIENLNFEKACRGFVQQTTVTPDICKIFVRKDAFDISCNGSVIASDGKINIEAMQKKYPDVYKSIEMDFSSSMDLLCSTEDKVQEKISNINAFRNPIAAIGPLIIILFAGPWSDKKNLRVPCMLVPMIGEAVGYLSKTISDLDPPQNLVLNLKKFFGFFF